ncbi:MAG: DUF3604 domain-containing protein [Halobacteriaceae archaeon]
MTDSDREQYGHATLDCPDEVVAGSYASWTVEYTVGALGMDDGSTLKVAANVSSDWGVPQFDDPSGENYATVETSGDAAVEAEYDPHGHVRPMRDTVTIHVSDGSLAPGDTITLTLGDRSGGSPGHQAQSFPENEFALLVLLDAFETGELVEVPPGELTFDFVAGPAEELVAVAPSTAPPGEVTVQVRGEDFWGNADRDYSATVRVEDDGETLGSADPEDGVAEVGVELGEGVHRLRVTDGELATTANPVLVGDHDTLYWGDIHGQSGETVGTGTIEEYFAFARDYAFLDFASHAGNDFQITESFWETVQDTVAEFHDPEEFVTYLCFEWSANTPSGGDHNVYFRAEEAELHPSSSWQSATEDGGPRHAGTCPVEDLYDRYEGRDDVYIIPHQGGRPARYRDEAFDPELTPFVEILSVWGVFEWFGREALDRGYPVGFVAGSDDHTGRLGASSPTNEADWAFPIDGGLMAAYADDLDRDALWEAMGDRRVYGTTGARIPLSVDVAGAGMGESVAVEGAPEIDVEVHGTAPLQRVDLFRGGDPEPVATEFFDGGPDRLELTWTGASSKDRHKVQDWSGTLSLDAGRIAGVEEVGFDHPTAGVQRVTNTAVHWEGSTAGNYQGLRLDLDAPDDATLSVATEPVQFDARVGGLHGRRVVDAGFLDRRMELRSVGGSDTLDAGLSFADDPDDGTHPYYVRVRQVDGEMAWSSPVFVTREG